MKFDRSASDDGIEDRRGQGGAGGGLGGGRFPIPMGRGGKIGIPAILAIVVALLVGRSALGGGGGGGGFDPTGALDQINGGQGAVTASSVPQAAEGRTRDAQYEFVRAVRQNVQDYWIRDFREAGRPYENAGLVIFDAPTPTGCGTGRPETGPFYCPTDKKVYIDFGFYAELERQFAIQGDFALAYVLAHEMGHHVQNELGINEQVQQEMGDRPDEANALSVDLELQADCLAGVWAHSAFVQGDLEEGDLEEAVNAAGQVGDDRIQQSTQGRVNPESFTHGTAEQRQRWFRTGYDGGDSSLCDTFADT